MNCGGRGAVVQVGGSSNSIGSGFSGLIFFPNCLIFSGELLFLGIYSHYEETWALSRDRCNGPWEYGRMIATFEVVFCQRKEDG